MFLLCRAWSDNETKMYKCNLIDWLIFTQSKMHVRILHWRIFSDNHLFKALYRCYLNRKSRYIITWGINTVLKYPSLCQIWPLWMWIISFSLGVGQFGTSSSTSPRWFVFSMGMLVGSGTYISVKWDKCVSQVTGCLTSQCCSEFTKYTFPSAVLCPLNSFIGFRIFTISLGFCLKTYSILYMGYMSVAITIIIMWMGWRTGVDKLAFENTMSEYMLYYRLAPLWYLTKKPPKKSREGYIFPADT